MMTQEQRNRYQELADRFESLSNQVNQAFNSQELSLVQPLMDQKCAVLDQMIAFESQFN